MRASAMIIQTNEIEKARYQYQLTPIPNDKQQTVAKNAKTKQSIKTLLNANKTKRNAHFVVDNQDDEGCDYEEDDLMDQQTSTSTSITTSDNKASNAKVLELTQEHLSEHDKLHAQTSGHNGQYTNLTRDYILKWTSEYQPPKDEKPFPVGQIPLDIYGHKLANTQQYLNKASNNGTSKTTLANPESSPSKTKNEVHATANQSKNILSNPASSQQTVNTTTTTNNNIMSKKSAVAANTVQKPIISKFIS